MMRCRALYVLWLAGGTGWDERIARADMAADEMVEEGDNVEHGVVVEALRSSVCARMLYRLGPTTRPASFSAVIMAV